MTPSSQEAVPSAPDGDARVTLVERCHAIEEAYEFMLAYAAQGLAHDAGAGSQIRGFLHRCDAALTDMGTIVTRCLEQRGVDAPAHHAFIQVVDGDARAAQAVVRLVLAQPAISSQLVDNLNASIHLRALLTDLFLLDEVLKT